MKCRKIRRLKSRSKSPPGRQDELGEAAQPESFVPAESSDVRMSIEQEVIFNYHYYYIIFILAVISR